MTSKFLDAYEMRARLLPAFITIAPIVIYFYVTFPELQTVWGGVVSMFVSLGLTAALARIARYLGVRKQAWLFEQWGGAPATAMLRHADERIVKGTKEKLHEALRKAPPRFDMPTQADEEGDPKAADQIYESVVDWLRRETRDQAKYPLVFSENVAFGFMRNLLGLKPYGLVACVGVIVWEGYSIYLTGDYSIEGVGVLRTISLLVDAILLAYWLLHIRPDAVKVPAEGYAHALIECCWEYIGKSPK